MMFCHVQDTSEKLQVGTYVWRNKDDPDLYGEWDSEVYKSYIIYLPCLVAF